MRLGFLNLETYSSKIITMLELNQYQFFVEASRYLTLDQRPKPSDAIFVAGNHSLDRATTGAALHLAGFAPRVAMFGRNSVEYADLTMTEAERYRQHMLKLGVPESAIHLQPCATNSLEEAIAFNQYAAVRNIRSAIAVTDYYHQRRVAATMAKQCPGIDFTHVKSCLPPDYRPGMLRLVAEEIVKLDEYGSKGDLVKPEIPSHLYDSAVKALAVCQAEDFLRVA